ncbi:MAG: tail fiber protein [Rhodospirillaceae bacterium]|nr:tail fiber protein [Rhodospirillaceae bacterium]
MDAFIGEIRAFPYARIPQGWLPCDGSLVECLNYRLLYSVILTTYGGDGRNTFALPDLRGRSPMGTGTDPWHGATYKTGDTLGSAVATVSTEQTWPHTHQVYAAVNPTLANYSGSPDDNMLSRTLGVTGTPYKSWSNNFHSETTMDPNFVTTTGDGQPHQNRQPGLTFQYCICFDGEYPSPDEDVDS